MEKNRRGRPKWAVGYIRVSTIGQADEGRGPEFQRECILAYARANGYRLTMIYQDVTTGNDRRSIQDRPEFRDAVRQAKANHGVIIVLDLSRVSRSEKKFLEFCAAEKVRIISTVPGETDDFASAVKSVAKAQKVRENIAAGTKRTFASMKKSGASLGNPASAKKANRSSARSRTTASYLKVLEIRDFLLSHPKYSNKSASEIADLLNGFGIFSGRGIPWTKESLRRQLRLARKELKLFEDDDDDQESVLLHP